ncbi:hypothetical protein BZA05DRAFT_408030 [Tricharina praecox]|uniref:uncharacterized protein n=1 Tax=Tricharina praecox TaxID=43433 RepID=UPI00221E7236|nr:uncharacterized protein BZA05DRAFT_408030 [Tricharina praecox]KAI5845546.1 hypothetical protein BZA05DRAFT_408030 [Tricharina praecox]
MVVGGGGGGWKRAEGNIQFIREAMLLGKSLSFFGVLILLFLWVRIHARQRRSPFRAEGRGERQDARGGEGVRREQRGTCHIRRGWAGQP